MSRTQVVTWEYLCDQAESDLHGPPGCHVDSAVTRGDNIETRFARVVQTQAHADEVMRKRGWKISRGTVLCPRHRGQS